MSDAQAPDAKAQATCENRPVSGSSHIEWFSCQVVLARKQFLSADPTAPVAVSAFVFSVALTLVFLVLALIAA